MCSTGSARSHISPPADFGLALDDRTLTEHAPEQSWRKPAAFGLFLDLLLSVVRAPSRRLAAGKPDPDATYPIVLATSRTPSMKRWASGPSERPFNVTIPTGRWMSGKLIGRTFNRK